MTDQKDKQKDNTLGYNQLMGRSILDDAVEHILKAQNPNIEDVLEILYMAKILRDSEIKQKSISEVYLESISESIN
jgi:hypothetical protein